MGRLRGTGARPMHPKGRTTGTISRCLHPPPATPSSQNSENNPMHPKGRDGCAASGRIAARPVAAHTYRVAGLPFPVLKVQASSCRSCRCSQQQSLSQREQKSNIWTECSACRGAESRVCTKPGPGPEIGMTIKRRRTAMPAQNATYRPAVTTSGPPPTADIRSMSKHFRL